MVRIKIEFQRKQLFGNTKSIISGIARNLDKQIALPTEKDGYFDRELTLVVASLCDTLNPLLHGEQDPVLDDTKLTVRLCLYAQRQQAMIPPLLEEYICQSIAYSYFRRNGLGDIIDIEGCYDNLHHAVLLKDGCYQRKPEY